MSLRSSDAAANSGPPSERVRLRRKRERGNYDREAIEAILDEALIAHLAVVAEDGQPLAIPTLHARCGDVVYCHGSVAGRTLGTLAGGVPICLTVSLLDGLVLARAAMHHSANYRSVMLLGTAALVTDPQEKRAALKAVVEHIVPGRAEQVRGPTEKELRATSVLAIPISEASAKIRSGGPMDDEEDYVLDVWAGVIPFTATAAPPVPDSRLRAGIAAPENVIDYRRPGNPRPRR